MQLSYNWLRKGGSTIRYAENAEPETPPPLRNAENAEATTCDGSVGRSSGNLLKPLS